MNMKRKEKVKDILEFSQLPKEVITSEPKITIIGENEVNVENHKGLIMYDESTVKINTIYLPLTIRGTNLTIRKMDNEMMVIYGNIRCVEYIKVGEEDAK